LRFVQFGAGFLAGQNVIRFLLTLPLTLPPSDSILAAASSRVNVSSVPVLTPARFAASLEK